MMLSAYFEDLTKAYQAELEDLRSDSEGNDILSTRLKAKRAQFALMMPMIDTAPEMVSVAFHGGVSFPHPHGMTMLSTNEPEEFPSWEEIAKLVEFAPWAEKLAEIALKETGGENFLITTVCLEYLHEKSNGNYSGEYAHSSIDESDDSVDEVERDEERDQDLETEGADWLAEQGFDRH
ncbi:hypothetical protein [Glaciimonas sp. PCH181]|uniref:hypothetical protein n=1 Tax=Glaciimonas sp. PCH181 TaxID=2133943 RepID=UPI000D336DBA|nr:hypothetical protein [Glaciimonas sp. PCH181]PUA17817.1 hypothetical protein C7W93_18325 [Glaciimonas sp. PCH181]